MTTYSTSDSRLAAFIITRGHALAGTDTRYQGDEDRVHLLFNVDETVLTSLKREFFEGGQCPALELLNQHKFVMHSIREARELARESAR
jgi:hypothetical protein